MSRSLECRVAGDGDGVVEREPSDEHRQPVEHDLFALARAARRTSPTLRTGSVDVRHRFAIPPTAAAAVHPTLPARRSCRASVPVPQRVRSPTASRPTADRSRERPHARRRPRWPVRPRRSDVRRTTRPHPRLTPVVAVRRAIDSGPSAMTCSPCSSSASRLVATTFNLWARLQQPIDQPCRRPHHMLTVVEHQQRRSRLEILDQTVFHRSSRHLPARRTTTPPPPPPRCRTTPRRGRRTTRRRRSRTGPDGRLRPRVGSCPSRRLRPRSPTGASRSDPTAHRARRCDR